MSRRPATLLLASSALGFLGAAEASGQTYPTRPVKLVIGFSAGGPKRDQRSRRSRCDEHDEANRLGAEAPDHCKIQVVLAERGSGAAFAAQAGRADKRIMETEWRPESLAIAQEIARHAEARGTTAGRFAVAWVLNNRLVTAAIAGPRTEEQWEDDVTALRYRFTAEDEALVDRLVAPGHPSTPGYNDPAYPLEGRLLLSGGA